MSACSTKQTNNVAAIAEAAWIDATSSDQPSGGQRFLLCKKIAPLGERIAPQHRCERARHAARTRDRFHCPCAPTLRTYSPDVGFLNPQCRPPQLDREALLPAHDTGGEKTAAAADITLCVVLFHVRSPRALEPPCAPRIKLLRRFFSARYALPHQRLAGRYVASGCAARSPALLVGRRVAEACYPHQDSQDWKHPFRVSSAPGR